MSPTGVLIEPSADESDTRNILSDVVPLTPQDLRMEIQTDAVNDAEDGAVGVVTTMACSTPEQKEEVYRSITKTWQPLERCKRVVERIWEDHFAISFHEPVDTKVYDDYLDVVGEPICLRDIRNRLENNEYKAQYLGKFAMDMRQIWKNCKVYNLYKSQIWHSAHALSLLFERLYQSWVLSYNDGMMPMNDPLARPWETTCRVCVQEGDDDTVMLCDHCDAYYHTGCLNPPLPKIPEGPWICKRCSTWLKRSGAKLLSASAEEEARQAAEGACHRKMITVRKKKYLVKWIGLSYRECTWETAADLNDDEKIKEFHMRNDTPPDEPPLTQAEIGAELSRDRKFALYPPMLVGDIIKDMDAAIYSQIRTFHFLKWNKIPPDALVKECGIASYAHILGARCGMVVPAYMKEMIAKIIDLKLKNKQVGLKEKLLNNQNVSETKEEDTENTMMKDEDDTKMEEDVKDEFVGKNDEADSTNVKAEEVDEEKDEEGDGEGEEDEKETVQRKRRIDFRNVSEAYDAREAAREAEEFVAKNSKKKKNLDSSSETNKRDNRLQWLPSRQPDNVVNEVAEMLSDIIHHISRRTIPGPEPSRPKLVSHEVEVCVPKGPSGLFMNIGDYKDRVVVLGFRKKNDNTPGPAESTGKIKMGDVLIAINGQYLTKLGFKSIIKLLSVKHIPYLYLRFLRLGQELNSAVEPIISTRLSRWCVSRLPVPIRSRFMGVYPVMSEDSMVRFEPPKYWVAEHFMNYERQTIGTFESEKEAALAYDAAMREFRNIAPEERLRFNFNENGELTTDAIALHRAVEAEISHTAKLLNKIKVMQRTDDKNVSLISSEEMGESKEEEESKAIDTDPIEISKEDLLEDDSSDSETDPDDDADREDGSSNTSEDEDSSTDEDTNDEDDEKDGEWRPKEDLDAQGPLGRLLRAVDQSENTPVKSEWINYMIELGLEESNAGEDQRFRKVEQIDLVTGQVIKVWDSVVAASRALNIPLYTIHNVLRNKADNSGGYKWNYYKAPPPKIIEEVSSLNRI